MWLSTSILCVIVPPEHPEIEDYTNGSVVKVPHEQKTLNLTCTCKNGKPAAAITWLRNGDALPEPAPVQYSITKLDNKLQDAMSILTITPKEEDNGAYFTCHANNEALPRPLETTLQLSVMRE